VRGLVDRIVLYPEGDHQRIEVRAELATILALAGGAQNAKNAQDADALAEQVKMVAGAGFEPAAFRL
jgi:site-specific DNA recombinase